MFKETGTAADPEKSLVGDGEAPDPDFSSLLETALGTESGDVASDRVGGTTGAGYFGVSGLSGSGDGPRVVVARVSGGDDILASGTEIDGDSLRVESTSDDTTIFVWYGSVDGTLGTADGLQAGAFVQDPDDDNALSPVLVSTNTTISIDGDRPENPEDFSFYGHDLYAIDGDGGFEATAEIFVGKPIQEIVPADASDPDNVIAARLKVDGTTPVNLPGRYWGLGGTPVEVTGIGTGENVSDLLVLGIGDSLIFQVKLGTSDAFRATDDYSKVILDVFGKKRTLYQRDGFRSDRNRDVLTYRSIIEEGDFDDLNESRVYDVDGTTTDPDGSNDIVDGITDTVLVFFVDKAGNRSSAGASVEAEADQATRDIGDPTSTARMRAKILIDAKRPALDSVNGDTILPVTVDTISDGSRNAGARRIGADENQMEYMLANTLDSLVIAFDGANDKSVTIKQPNPAINGALALKKGDTYTVDFTQFGIKQAKTDTDVPADTVYISTDGEDPFKVVVAAASEEIGLKTGMHTIKFTATDVAGNVGPALTRENVYVDVDNIDFVRSFPFGSGEEESGLDTIEAKTSVVVFRLSEPADSVSIEYKGIAMGADADSNDVGKSRHLPSSAPTWSTPPPSRRM